MHCTPVARSIKQAWPSCSIHWLVGRAGFDLLRYNPDIDEIILWPREDFDSALRCRKWREAWSLWQQLRHLFLERFFYAAIDLQGLFLTGMIMTQVRAKHKIGLSHTKEGNSWFMGEIAAAAGPAIVDHYLSVLKPLGIADRDRRPVLLLAAEDYEAARLLLVSKGISSGEPFVVFVLGTTWPSKNWPAAYWVELAKAMQCSGEKVVLCGGRLEVETARYLQQMLGQQVISLVNETTLLTLGAVLARARLVIGGDTGPMYMAAALQVPTLFLFGPTDPLIYGSFGEKSFVAVQPQDCSFCHKRRCPEKHGNCMKELTPEIVFAAIQKILFAKK